jgi:hypothetical protein
MEAETSLNEFIVTKSWEELTANKNTKYDAGDYLQLSFQCYPISDIAYKLQEINEYAVECSWIKEAACFSLPEKIIIGKGNLDLGWNIKLYCGAEDYAFWIGVVKGMQLGKIIFASREN